MRNELLDDLPMKRTSEGVYRFQPDYKAMRKRAASLSARPFPSARFTDPPPPTKWQKAARLSRTIWKFVCSAVAIAVFCFAVFFVGFLLSSVIQHESRIRHVCNERGHIIHRGLCIEPETLKKILRDQKGL